MMAVIATSKDIDDFNEVEIIGDEFILSKSKSPKSLQEKIFLTLESPFSSHWVKIT